MKPPIRLALVWHFHQPEYTDPFTGRATLPWTRLHAIKDYADMADRLARHPGVRATINVVPSLIDQLEALARQGNPPDPFLEAATTPATELTAEQRRFIVTNFFSFNCETMARDLRRVQELLALRGEYGPDALPQHAVDRFDADALRDLQVLLHLVWSGPLLRKNPKVKALIDRGRRYTEGDKQELLEIQRGFVGGIVPAWRALADQGHVEFSVSAYYHPILPLLCSLESAHDSLPQLKLPAASFAHPEDARTQIAAGIARFTEVFGKPPAGGWPPEGAISEAALRLLGEGGYRWAASDEDVLFASLGERLSSDRAAAEVRRGTLLYRPWRHGSGPVLLFRDHDLSDRIGFVYSAWQPGLAAEDFVRRLLQLRETLPEDGAPYTVSVILDGENAWEYYPGNAEAFFDALYGALASEKGIQTVTAAEAADPAAARELPRVVAGSWIGRNLATWIGHKEKNRAWEHLAETRRFVEGRRGAPDRSDAAWRAVLAAEGSDWFWWFGDDHFSAHAAEFDASFRRQLRAAWEAAGVEPPDALTRPIRESSARTFRLPTGVVNATIDGRVTDYFEWLPAGRAESGSGAMHAATRLVREVYYGSDGTRLFLRLDPTEPPASSSLGGAVLIVRVAGHPDNTVRVALPASGTARSAEIEMAVDRIVEVSVPLTSLPAAEKGIHFQVEIETLEGASHRIPSDGSLYLPSAQDDSSRFDWSV